MSTTLETWLPEARQSAAQCWCHESTKHIVMDPALCEVVARAIAGWMDAAAQHCRNESYYRGLLEECGAAIGAPAFVCDSGDISQDVLCAKIPELVKQLVPKKSTMRGDQAIILYSVIEALRNQFDRDNSKVVIGDPVHLPPPPPSQ